MIINAMGKCHKIHGKCRKSKKKMKNFLDDIFMVFMGSMTALDKFFEEINKVQSKIKFTMTLNTPNIVS